MAARLRPRHQHEIREKIRASQIVTRLTSHALGRLKKPMDASQVTAALGLLKKCMPDLAQTALTGPDGEALFDKVERVIVREKK
jgi:hypothetical protein